MKYNLGKTAIAFAAVGLAFGTFAINGAHAGATVQKCKTLKNSRGDMMCECLVRTDARKKPRYVYFTSAGANCTYRSGNPPTLSMIGQPGKKSLSYASNSSSILSLGVGTTFGVSGGLVVGNSNSNAGSIGSNSANAGGGADGGAGGVGSGGFSAGGAGGSTSSSASTN